MKYLIQIVESIVRVFLSKHSFTGVSIGSSDRSSFHQLQSCAPENWSGMVVIYSNSNYHNQPVFRPEEVPTCVRVQTLWAKGGVKRFLSI